MSGLPWQVRLGRLSLKKRAKLRALLPLVGRWGPGRYLEIGPEKGVLAHELKRLHPGVFVHADGDAGHLRSTRELTGDPVVRVGSSLPFPDAAFDGVLLVDHLEHVHDDQALLREVFRVTRPGGPAIVSAPRLPGPLGGRLRRFLGMRRERYGHLHDGYPPGELRRMTMAAGFRVESDGACVGPLTETVELLLNAAFSLVSRLKGYRGGGKGSIAPQNREEAEGSAAMIMAYRLLFPLLLLVTWPDRLLGARGSVIFVTARRED